MAKKRRLDDPLATLLETASKAKLIDLIIRLASTRPAVRHECLDYLTRRTALSPSQRKQSEGEKLLALWAELAPDLDELDAYGGGDYDDDLYGLAYAACYTDDDWRALAQAFESMGGDWHIDHARQQQVGQSLGFLS